MPKKGERIYKRNDGRWEGRYRSGINRDGKSVYRSVYGKSYYEVKKKLSACNESSEPIELSSKKSPLFKDVIVLWQKANQNRYKGATALKYSNLIDSHILPSLGGYRLSEINTFVLADFMDNKLNTGRLDRAGGLSPSYVRSITVKSNDNKIAKATYNKASKSIIVEATGEGSTEIVITAKKGSLWWKKTCEQKVSITVKQDSTQNIIGTSYVVLIPQQFLRSYSI